MSVVDITPRDDLPEPTVQQQDAARTASTVEWFTDRGLYADDAAAVRMRDRAVGAVIEHMRNHDPSPTRWKRCAEILAFRVENQLRAVPGGRLFLANRDNRIPRTWWETS